MVAMGLIFRRFIPEGALDALTKLEFGPGSGPFNVRESFPSEVFNLRQKSLQLLDTLGQVFEGGGF